jgi:nitrite reductase/ring-hydroxylating ferredoxin subunit
MDNLTPFFTDEEYTTQLMPHIQARLDELEQLPFPQVKDAMLDLLGSIDMMHREAFVRLLLLIQQESPPLLERLQTDTVIHSVLSLYEFIPSDEVEIAATPAGNNTFIPLDQIGVSPSIKEPIWIPGGNIADLPPGTFRSQKFEDVDVLLCNVAGEIFALHNACLHSILPLSSGRLEGHTVICPWHGCRYDVRTGEIEGGSGLKLDSYPVAVDEQGRLSVGFNIPK